MTKVRPLGMVRVVSPQQNRYSEFKPTIMLTRDQGQQFVQVERLLGRGMLVGMMSMTYPQDQTIIVTSQQ